MKNRIHGFFNSEKEAPAEQTVEPVKFVTLEEFLAVPYDPEAINKKTGELIWLEIPKKKVRKSEFALNPQYPEQFLSYLAKCRTYVIARTLKANRDKLQEISNAVTDEPVNPPLYACYALLADDITKLDLGKLIAVEQYFKCNQESDRGLAKTIDVIINLKNPQTHADFAESLKTRCHEDYYLNLAGMTFTEIKFDKANLNYADMRNTKLTNCSFVDSTLYRVDFHAAVFNDVKMSNVIASDANFCKCKFTNFSKDNITYARTTFISPSAKLDLDALNKTLNGLQRLDIPPYVVLENVYRNLANKKLKYTTIEKHALLGMLGVHELFNSKNPEPEYQTNPDRSAPTRQHCRETIQRDWEELAIEISKTQNTNSPKM